MIKKKQKIADSQSLDVRGPLRYAVYGSAKPLFPPLPEALGTPEVPLASIKRLLLDGLLFAPAFLLLFFLAMSLLEGKDPAAFATWVRSGFWPSLRMNWRMWTPLQFININYVPLQQFRVLFANLVAVFWYPYLASLGK
ncbi:Peroxisomal membrane protein 2 [Heterocephalus glaber]|uniref:Peroxisomal membrane protein 2 n=1 Tax=Heterocephalus glaber TaxID=10181 RepID=G5ANV8_HETGA|nr:Peroxisomal membrane protein 2 [Heterocephalus glaber]